MLGSNSVTCDRNYFYKKVYFVFLEFFLLISSFQPFINVVMSATHLKLMPIATGRASEESEVFSLRDEDPLSLPSEALLDDHNNKLTQQPKSIVKSSAINLFWILMW